MDFPLGCCQRTIAGKTPATSHGMGSWQGIDQVLTNFWATLCIESFLGDVILVSPTKCAYKSGWLEVDQELDMGCQLLTRTFPCWNCRGLSCRIPLATRPFSRETVFVGPFLPLPPNCLNLPPKCIFWNTMRAGINTFRIPGDVLTYMYSYWLWIHLPEEISCYMSHVRVFVSVTREIPATCARYVYLIQIDGAQKLSSIISACVLNSYFSS